MGIRTYLYSSRHRSSYAPVKPNPCHPPIQGGTKTSDFHFEVARRYSGPGTWIPFTATALGYGNNTIPFPWEQQHFPGYESVDNGGTFSPVLLQVQNLAPRCGDGGDTGQLLLNKIQWPASYFENCWRSRLVKIANIKVKKSQS